MSANIQTFEFSTDDQTDDDTELVFRVVDSWENRYGDQKVAVETPAPWDTPDDIEAANDIVKALEWDDHHYTFDKDRKAWTLDFSGLKPLAEMAQDAGYEWEGVADRRRRLEGSDGPRKGQDDGPLGDLCEEAREAEMSSATDYEYEGGDRIKVRYAKKNGNGENVYKGRVTSVSEPNDERRTVGVVFEDENGKTKRVKRGEKGDVGLFSSGYHPYMGEVLEVTLIR